jgi:hypothetical protein
VALFASAGSVTAAKVVSCSSMALPLDSNVRDPNVVYLIVEYDRISRAIEVDRVVSFVLRRRTVLPAYRGYNADGLEARAQALAWLFSQSETA